MFYFTVTLLAYLPSVCKYAESALPPPGEAHGLYFTRVKQTSFLVIFFANSIEICHLVCKVCAYFCEYAKYAQGVVHEFQLYLQKCFVLLLNY